MSGITGIYHFEKTPVPGNYGYKLMKALQKRPDQDAIIWQKGNVFLGWIPPKTKTKATFCSIEGQLVIAADIRLDNREELMERLEVNREEQKSTSDVQLIQLAYQEWESSSPKYLQGDFTFMIWDEKHQVLFGARDYVGNKLLYYYTDTERFAFCTKMAPLLTLPYVTNDLNNNWFNSYIIESNERKESNESITPYQCIFQVPPGHAISITKDVMELSNYRTRRSLTNRTIDTIEYQEYI